jgi:hypothetical protein
MQIAEAGLVSNCAGSFVEYVVSQADWLLDPI